MRSIFCKHIEISYVLCESKKRTVIKSTRLSRIKCMKYVNYFENQVLTDYHQMKQRLAIAHNLRKKKKKKSVLHVENEFELLKTLYISTKTTFSHERYRVQLTLIMQLAEITDNRLSILLTIRYQHIKMILLSDFDDEKQFRVLIEIVFHHIKDYFEKKMRTFFCFTLYLLPLLFVSSSLTSVTEKN